MPTKNKTALGTLSLRLSGFLLIALLWEVLPRAGVGNPAFFPPLSAVWDEGVDLIRHQHLLGHTVVTLWRVLMGITMASLLAVPIGIILGFWLQNVAESLNPLFRILAQVNPFSLMTVFLLFFGVGEKAKLIIVIWVAFWPLVQHTLTGARNLDADMVTMARSMGLSPWQMFIRVLLPGTAPAILLGIRSSVILLLAILVAGEMLGGMAGLGWLLHWSSNFYSYPYATTPVFATGLCITLIGVGISIVLRRLERDLFFWKPTPKSIWNAEPADKVNRGRPRGIFAAVVLSLALVLLLTGGIETSVLSKTNGSISDESNEVPPPDFSLQPNATSTPKAGRSGSSENSSHMDHMDHMKNMDHSVHNR